MYVQTMGSKLGAACILVTLKVLKILYPPIVQFVNFLLNIILLQVKEHPTSTVHAYI